MSQESPSAISSSQLQLLVFLFLLISGPFLHQCLKSLRQPFLRLSPLKIFAQRMEVVFLPLELGGGVDEEMADGDS